MDLYGQDRDTGSCKNYWLWTFSTPDDEVVVGIRLSRDGDVLREIFGLDINGAGAQSYSDAGRT